MSGRLTDFPLLSVRVGGGEDTLTAAVRLLENSAFVNLGAAFGV